MTDLFICDHVDIKNFCKYCSHSKPHSKDIQDCIGYNCTERDSTCSNGVEIITVRCVKVD